MIYKSCIFSNCKRCSFFISYNLHCLYITEMYFTNVKLKWQKVVILLQFLMVAQLSTWNCCKIYTFFRKRFVQLQKQFQGTLLKKIHATIFVHRYYKGFPSKQSWNFEAEYPQKPCISIKYMLLHASAILDVTVSSCKSFPLFNLLLHTDQNCSIELTLENLKTGKCSL